MQQTNFPFYVWVHDDASTDGTTEIVKEYEKKHPDLIHASLEKENQYSQGKIRQIIDENIPKDIKYIAFCEGDDYWTDPNKLQMQVDYMEQHPECILTYTDYDYKCTDNGVYIKRMFEQQNGYRPKSFIDHLVHITYMAPMSWVYRSSLNINKTSFIDLSFEMMLNAFLQGKVSYLPKSTCVYVSHAGSATRENSWEKQYKYKKDVFEEQLYYAKKYDVDKYTLALIKENGYLSVLPFAIKIGDKNFVKEATAFFHTLSVDIDFYLNAIYERNQMHQSHAYRLGKLVVQRFSWLKKFTNRKDEKTIEKQLTLRQK